jgi:hypothetical protein
MSMSAEHRLTVLYRPVGAAELALIRQSGFRAFPPRLPEQPIFYPVTTESYAVKIARDWNAKHGSGGGFVTRFAVERDYLDRFDRHAAGGREHIEYWIPAGELAEFNSHIRGHIEVIAEFPAVEAARAVSEAVETTRRR